MLLVGLNARFLTDSAAARKPRFPSCRHRFTTRPCGSNRRLYGGVRGKASLPGDRSWPAGRPA